MCEAICLRLHLINIVNFNKYVPKCCYLLSLTILKKTTLYVQAVTLDHDLEATFIVIKSLCEAVFPSSKFGGFTFVFMIRNFTELK